MFGIFRVLLAPIAWFQRSVTAPQGWRMAALLLLVILGWHALRVHHFAAGAALPVSPDPSFPSDPSFEGDFSGGGGVLAPVPMSAADDLSGIPPDLGQTGPLPDGAASAVPALDEDILVFVRGASGLLAVWIIQTVILLIAPMLNGAPPDFGRGFQTAVWASAPIGVWALVQVGYMAAGGDPTSGRIGFGALLDAWPGYAALSGLAAALITVLAESITLWNVWSVILLYLGARFAFAHPRTGRPLSVGTGLIVVLLFVISAIMLRTALGVSGLMPT